MEIMGLGVLVVLIALGMLIYLSTSSTKEQETPQKSFSQRQLGINFLTAYKEVSVDCGLNQVNIEELVKYCALNSSFTCYGETHCKVLNDTTTEILTKSLDEWNVKYNLSIEDIPYIYTSNFANCTEREAPGVLFVSSKFKPIKMELQICIQ